MDWRFPMTLIMAPTSSRANRREGQGLGEEAVEVGLRTYLGCADSNTVECVRTTLKRKGPLF